MRNKAVFLDRDGTINIEKNYLYRVEDFEFLPGVIDALQRLQHAGYILVIITNQSGIARGYYTEDDLQVLNDWMLSKLKDAGIFISKIYYCPHLPDAIISKYKQDCNCRKPKLGLYEQAVSEFGINLNQSYAIGDKIRDCEICKHSKCKGFLIGRNEKPEIIKKVKDGDIENIKYATSLLDAIQLIFDEL